MNAPQCDIFCPNRFAKSRFLSAINEHRDERRILKKRTYLDTAIVKCSIHTCVFF
jgi:hypothetical protein